MSDSYGMDASNGARPDSPAPGYGSQQPGYGSQETGYQSGEPGSGSGKADAAKEQAANLKDTVTDEAAGVIGTAKEEVASVAHEAKSQAKDLFAQTTDELSSQVHNQQRRLADGLRSTGQDLRSMADSSEQGGVASDLVREVSHRVESVGAWLGDRTPGSVLTEVKRFARRKPGMFLLAAVAAGVTVGRLSRALASGSSSNSSSSGHLTGTSATGLEDRSTLAGSAPLVSGTTADTTLGTGADATTGYTTGASGGSAGLGAGTASGAGTTTGLGTGTDAFPAAPDGMAGSPDTPLYDEVSDPGTDRIGGDDDRRDTL